MLRVDGLSFLSRGPYSLALPAGAAYGIEGPSGAGKSLLLRAIADLIPSAGRVYLDDTERGALPAPSWRRRVCYLPAVVQWWAPRVAEHFEAPPDPAALAALGLDRALLDAAPSRLSTGEAQRLQLLRALAVRPEILLLDEPSAALDQTATAQLEALLRDRRAGGLSLLWVSHDHDQLLRSCDEIYTLSERGLAPEADR